MSESKTIRNKSWIINLMGCVGMLLCFACTTTLENSKNEIRSANEKGEIISIKGSRQISGIFPHLTTYAHGRENGTYDFGNECEIGALAIWNDKLYMLNYAAHQPNGSEHKLYIVDKDKKLKFFEGSIGNPSPLMFIRTV